jgi:DNA repair exonuclease SbcCD ATPase subunit
MGDNAEFEKLSTLEARLAAALDRIATGLGEALTHQPPEDPAVTSSAFEELQIRAQVAEARVTELEAAQARAKMLEAERDTLARTMAERDADLEALRAELAAASAPSAPDAIDALTAQVADLEGKLTRLRAERAEALAERDAARDLVEELQAAAGAGPDDHAMALRAEVQDLRAINERLTRTINQLRGEHARDPEVLNKALVVELAALKAARASEAAELDRILADLARADAGEGAHA